MILTITALSVVKLLVLLGVIVGVVFGFFAFVALYGLSGKFGPALGLAVFTALINWVSLALYFIAVAVWIGSRL